MPTFKDRGVSRGQRNGSPRPLISVFWTGAATFYSSSSSIDLTRLSGPRSLTSPTGGGRSVGVVRSRTKATEFSFSLVTVCNMNVIIIILCDFKYQGNVLPETCRD